VEELMRSLDKKTVAVGLSVTIGLLLVGLAGVVYMTKSSTINALSEQESQLLMLREQLAGAGDQASFTPAAANKRWELHSGPEVVLTMQAVQKLGDAAGVEFVGLKALRSADSGKQSFAIAGHGTPDDVCAFLASVEQNDRLMIVETGRMVPAGGDQVAFEFGLATYHAGGQ
jgi:hypothetical protein